MTRNRKLSFAALLPVVSLLAVAGCGGDSNEPASAQDEVKIGAVYPLSGPLATDGTNMFRGVELAVEEANAAGGIEALGGATISLDSRDSQGKPELATTAAQALIDGGAVGLVGSWLSSNTLATTQVAERAGIPHLVDTSLTDEIIDRGFEYTFRITYGSGRASERNLEMLRELVNQSGSDAKTAVLLHEDSAYGTGLATAWAEQAPEYGFEVAKSIAYSRQATDLSAEVAQANATGADLLVSTGYGPDSLLLLKATAEQGASFKGIIGLSSAAFYSPSFYAEAKELADGLIDTNQGVAVDSEGYQQFAEGWRKKFNTEPDLGGAYAYTATKVLLQAIENAKSADPQDIKAALETGSFADHPLPQGPIAFDERGQNQDATPIMYQWQEGTRRVVLPAEFATAEPVFPNR